MRISNEEIKMAILDPVLTAQEAAEELRHNPAISRDNAAAARKSGLPQIRSELSAENVRAQAQRSMCTKRLGCL